jgi:nucleoside-diphosphate-sugar epimerase
MRALVTGDAGFLGRHFTAELKQRGYAVTGIDIRHSPSQDVRDWLRGTGAKVEPFDLVVHCAAVVGGRAVIDGDPLATAVNLELDAALLRWAAVAEPGRVLYLSSSAAYPVAYQRNHGSRLKEGDVYLPHDVMQPDQVYGWTKVMGEILCQRLREAGVPVTVVRPFSGYGSDQDADYPFRAFVDRAKKKEDPFRLWCGHCVRDFVHVDDVVNGTLAAVSAGADGPINICTGSGTSFYALARRVCTEAGYEPEIIGDPSAPAGVLSRVGDPLLMAQYWTPAVSLDEGVRRAFAD